MNKLPNHGTKTHPLTDHAYDALGRIEKEPQPTLAINPGLRDRLLREDLVETVELPNPYATTRRTRPLYPHLRITEAGRQALAARPR